MKCPACFSELSSVTIGQLTVDMCRGGCGGTWFDAFELQQVDESHESAGQMQLSGSVLRYIYELRTGSDR